MNLTGRIWLIVALPVLLALGGHALHPSGPGQIFDHSQHRTLFPSCLSCHPGAQDPAQPLWPRAEGCATCHDGKILGTVEWQPPAVAAPTNLRFTHAGHADQMGHGHPAPAALHCADCHTEPGGGWMQVSRAVVDRCFGCHGVKIAHLEASDTACATCHLPLADAVTLSLEEIRRFPAPPSHEAADFLSAKGHGRLSAPVKTATRTFPVAPSCATCHARDFCSSCHVDAPEQPTIQALAPDLRSLAHQVTLVAPASHSQPDFLSRHGSAARPSAASCATCHTRESCSTCHAAQPGLLRALPASGPGRGRGAVLTRYRPASHGSDFTEAHAPIAASSTRLCAGCHARSDCLDCHRPDPAAQSGYHPPAFLSRHPAAAYGRESSCADCHNPGAFCVTCHQQAGLTATGLLQPGYHDAKQSFLFGHGQAARLSLETCVGCHAERDCLACHSTSGRLRFSPHGPGFDAARLKRRNPEMCTACHGAAIP